MPVAAPVASPNLHRYRAANAGIALLLAVGLEFLVIFQFGLIFAWIAVALVALLCLALAKPEIATVAVVFIVYANLASIAVEFHAVPRIAAVAFFLVLLLPATYHLLVRGEPLRTDRVLAWLFVYLIVLQYNGNAALQSTLNHAVLLYLLPEACDFSFPCAGFPFHLATDCGC